MKSLAALGVLLGALCAAPAFAFPKRSLDSEHFRFYYDEKDLMVQDTVRMSAEAAYRRISADFGFEPKVRIPVVLYADRAEFQRETGVKRSELVLGVATSSDEAIRLDASRIFESPDRVVGHETVHIFLYYMLGPYIGDLPLWLNEGLAQEAGGADKDLAHLHVTDALLNGQVMPLGDLTKRFPEGDTAGLAYDEAQDATQTLLADDGWPKMRALLWGLKSGRSFDTALRDAYGFGTAGFESRWQRSIRTKARFAFWMQVAEWVVPLMMFVALIWGIITVRRHKRKQILDEEPLVEIQPPSWWKEDQWR